MNQASRAILDRWAQGFAITGSSTVGVLPVVPDYLASSVLLRKEYSRRGPPASIAIQSLTFRTMPADLCHLSDTAGILGYPRGPCAHIARLCACIDARPCHPSAALPNARNPPLYIRIFHQPMPAYKSSGAPCDIATTPGPVPGPRP